MNRSLTIDAYLSDNVEVEIYPDDDPKLIAWADSRGTGPRSAIDMLVFVADRLKFWRESPTNAELDLRSCFYLETEIRDVLRQVAPFPGDKS
jgi:hypothetical protein